MRLEFEQAIDKALEGAHAITWDGCHKIYILLDETQTKFMQEVGYSEGEDDFFLASSVSKQDMFSTLYEWWDTSCGLRFISSIRTINGQPNTNEGFTDVIPQGTDTDEGEEEEGL